MTRYNYRLVALTAFAVVALAVPDAALAQEAGEQEAEGLERVLRATEGLPSDERDEIVSVYQEATSHVFVFYDPACIALSYWEWRRENPDGPGGLRQLRYRDEEGRISTCADRDRIAGTITAIVEGPGSPYRQALVEDQLRRLSTCTAELVADRYLENPGPNPPSFRYQVNLRSRALSECRRQLDIR